MAHENNLHVVKTRLNELNDRVIQYRQCVISYSDVLPSEIEQDIENREYFSHSSAIMSTLSSRVREKARLAELIVEKSTLAKRKAIKARQC